MELLSEMVYFLRKKKIGLNVMKVCIAVLLFCVHKDFVIVVIIFVLSFLSAKSHFDGKKAIRGGIPLVFRK